MELLLCDACNRLGLLHGAVLDTRLVTTPTLRSVFVRQGHLSSSDGVELLGAISETRSWDANSYVQRARSLLSDD